MVATLEHEPRATHDDWPRVRLFGVNMDVLDMSSTLKIIQSWTAAPFDRCRYVVTPNVDHTVLLQDRRDLRDAYHDADLVLADGWPVVAASRIVGKPLPERVAGSDLVPRLLAAGLASQPLRVFLLGAAPGVGEKAARNIHRRYDGVDVVGVHSPPLGFENREEESNRILYLVGQTQPDILVVGLGAPKQELWVHAHRDQLKAKVALCVGATIDFIAGEKSRAPRWLQRLGLEWLHRILSEPRRLAKRYAHDASVFPGIVWREWRDKGLATR
ncbi:MAG: WecB/TagA/CpsF family glycosyltransferase [Planctomycetaceae bacterium]|nr:WecB/TagA/CpsF family glycosyltransferase [Planctomycetales bacterium]MCB9926589.1 WecB/TagA/CpsF family glycosyltransferase [Planctomycetaceae bacterium]